MSQSIYVVEDQAELAQVLVDYLKRDGFAALAIGNGAQALAEIRRAPPALVLLDVMLPGMDGLNVLRELRRFSDLPVIMVTARLEEIDRLLGLELGADDYVCKPFSPREVVARVKTVLRRFSRAPAGTAVPAVSAIHKVEIDQETWQASIDGKRLNLTPMEFRLLQALADKPGRVYSRSQLLDLIYEDNLDVSERAVDSHMKNLRRKLAQAMPGKDPIRSVYGVGFVFEGWDTAAVPDGQAGARP
jgi:two-component system response regulator BaeR